MRNSSTLAPAVSARQRPTKLTSAPASSRPAANLAVSSCGSKDLSARRTVISASAHRRQKGDLVTVGYGARKILRHTLIEDQPGRRLLHRLAQIRFGPRNPAF